MTEADTNTDNDTNTRTDTDINTNTNTNNDANTGTDADTGTNTGTDTETVSQDSSAGSSGTIDADLAAIDELGMCDGSWVSDLDETNSDRPPGLDELTESWRCQFDDFDTQVLRWANAAETRANLLTLKRLTADAGVDPASWQFVFKDDHIIGVGTFDAGSGEETEMLNRIQAKIGGEVMNLSEFS